MSTTPGSIKVRVRTITWLCDRVRAYELCGLDDAELPPFTAGAHIDVQLGNGLSRSYSLCNDPEERHRYVIAVQREPAGRGGSVWIHDKLGAGEIVEIERPLNHFALAEDAETHVLIAGGIGITPVLSMARRLNRTGRDWRLHFAVRDRAHAPFLSQLDQLDASGGNRVHLHVDAENGSAPLDIGEVVRAGPANAHLYCCGPEPMLAAFEAACAGLDCASVHMERFTGVEAPALDGGFEVELARAGVTLTVAEGQSILGAITEAGIDAPYSCTEGICGTCVTTVLSGTPDHRDLVLTDQEKQAGDVMLICCSGSKGPRLVLDF